METESLKSVAGKLNKVSLLNNLTLYPHFKLTDERFPRLLVTRKIAADNAEYFGAFLPEMGVRFADTLVRTNANAFERSLPKLDLNLSKDR